jgi:tartrate-resistant acid phosphatase type 5
MSDTLREEFLHVPHVDHQSALIAWGAFFFETEPVKKNPALREYELMDDDKLKKKGLRKRGSIGRVTEQYGTRVRVRVGQVTNAAEPFGAYHALGSDPDAGVAWEPFTEVQFNTHLRVAGLRPRTRYRYQVEIDGKRWDERGHEFFPKKDAREGTCRPEPRRRRHEFFTFPAPGDPSGDFAFAVVGDPGTGEPAQYSVGRGLAARVEPDAIRLLLTTGDNIYARGGKLGKIIRGALGRAASSGDEDDDWFASWFLPYRDTISRVPVFPAIGNHDSEQSEDDDDLGQMMDNFYLEERLLDEASLWGIGALAHDTIFYRFRYGRDAEFVSIDTSFSDRLEGQNLLDQLITAVKGKRKPPLLHENHKLFLEQIEQDPRKPAWRIPYGHHPPYSLGPSHHDNALIQQLAVRLRDSAGVRVWLAGHEHNFQHHARDGIDYVLSGAAGKSGALTGKDGKPPPSDVVSYTDTPHALVANIRGGRLRIRLFGEQGQVMPRRRDAPAVPSLVEIPAV